MTALTSGNNGLTPLDKPIVMRRDPTTSDTVGPDGRPVSPGRPWVNVTTAPYSLFFYGGAGVWLAGGDQAATPTVRGTVMTDEDLSTAEVDTVPTSVAAKAYIDAAAIAGGVVALETTAGIGELATDVEAVAGTASTGVLALFLTPSNLAPVFAASPAIGGTTPAAGAFTTLAATGAVDFDAGGSWESGGAAIDIGADASGDAVNIGTGAAARVMAIGNVTGATSLDVSVGTGNFTLEGDVASTYGISATGANTGTITIGGGTGAQTLNMMNSTAVKTVNIASGAAANVITMGSVTGAASLDLLCGTGNFSLEGDVASTYDISGTGANTGTITIGGGTGAQILNMMNSTSVKTVNIAAGAAANIVTIGSVTGAASLDLLCGTGDFTLEGDVASTYDISSTGVNTGTVTIAAGTGARTVNLATGGTGAKTVNIATAAIGNIVTIGTVTAAASLDLLCGTGNFSLEGDVASTYDISSTGVNTGTVTIASGTGARTLELAGGGTGAKTINIGAAASADLITIGDATGAGSLDLVCGTGNFTLEGATASTYSISETGVNTGTLSIGGGTGARIVNLAVGGTGAKTVNIATAAIGNIVTIGSVTAAASLDLLCGTGNFTLEGDVASTYGISSTGVNTGAVTIASGTGARTLELAGGGTGAKTVNIGAAASADVITIGDATGAGSLDLVCGTGNFTLEGATASTYDISGTGANTGIITLGGGTGAQTTNISNNTGIKTINIAGAGATSANIINMGTGAGDQTITVGSTNTTSSLVLSAGTGFITMNGGHAVSVTAVNNAATPYTVLGGDYFIDCDTSAGVLQVTLPAATALSGRSFVIRDMGGSAGANNITINGGGTNLVGGAAAAATKVIAANYAGARVTSNGTIWAYEYVA